MKIRGGSYMSISGFMARPTPL